MSPRRGLPERGQLHSQATLFARGLAHSRTLRAVREPLANAPASWTAVALHRFGFRISALLCEPQPERTVPRVQLHPNAYCLAKLLRVADPRSGVRFCEPRHPGERNGCQRARRRIRCSNEFPCTTEKTRAEVKLMMKSMLLGRGALYDCALMARCFPLIARVLSKSFKIHPSPGKNISARLRLVDRVARCEVQDQAPNLSADHRQKLLDKFARPSAKPTGGESATGLGLSIVKELAEAMSGRVWCESEPGWGATFVVQFPPE
jgi:hypothetical protein